MRQNWLLLKACRRGILKGFLLGTGVPLGVLAFALFVPGAVLIFFGGADILPEILPDIFPESAMPWIYEQTFFVTLLAALVAGACHLRAGLSTTLNELPAPVSFRQQAYIPLVVTLVHWAVLMGVYSLPLVIGTGLSGTDYLPEVLSDVIWAFPLGFLLIALLNRPANLYSSLGNSVDFLTPLLILSSLATLTDLNFQREIAFTKEIYPILQPLFLLAALLVVWETPNHRQNWHRAAFTTVPWGTGTTKHREMLPPQRIHPLSMIITVSYIFLSCVAWMALLFYSVRLIPTVFTLQAEQRLLGIFGVCAALAFLYCSGKAALLHMQSRRLYSKVRWMQGTPSAHDALERWKAIDRDQPLVARCPETNFYRRPGRKESEIESPQMQKALARVYALKKRWGFGNPLSEAKLADMFSASSRPSQWLDSTSVVFILILLSVSTGLGIGGYRAREGSNIQGDIASRPDEHYQAPGAFSQHYVALNLGKNTPSVQRESALAAIQAIVEDSPDPASWLAGLRTTEGEAAQVPEKYRIEVSQPEPNIVVVQSMGLHWEPAGHLAYALAKHIQEGLEGIVPIKTDPKYTYHRSAGIFEPAYGFLDNTAHWVRPEAEKGAGA